MTREGKVELISVWQFFEEITGRKFTKKEKKEIVTQMRSEYDFDHMAKNIVPKYKTMKCRKCGKMSESIKFGYCRKCAKKLGAKFNDEHKSP